jgi:hypothetical protein
VWGFRASDIYQGGETEPLQADRDLPAAFPSLDNESRKNYLPRSCAECTRIINNANSTMTVLFPVQNRSVKNGSRQRQVVKGGGEE